MSIAHNFSTVFYTLIDFQQCKNHLHQSSYANVMPPVGPLFVGYMWPIFLSLYDTTLSFFDLVCLSGYHDAFDDHSCIDHVGPYFVWICLVLVFAIFMLSLSSFSYVLLLFQFDYNLKFHLQSIFLEWFLFFYVKILLLQDSHVSLTIHSETLPIVYIIWFLDSFD